MESFEWEIVREEDLMVLQRSTRLFATRIEAILDSAQAAATLTFNEQSSDDGGNQKSD